MRLFRSSANPSREEKPQADAMGSEFYSYNLEAEEDDMQEQSDNLSRPDSSDGFDRGEAHDLELGEEESGEKSDESGENAAPGRTKKGKPSPAALFLMLFAAPLRAWKRLKNSGLTSDEVGSGLFYPLVGLTSLGAFAGILYDEGLTVSAMLSEALAVFVSFFIGYHLLVLAGSLLLPGDAKTKIDTQYGRSWAMMLVATQALYYLLYELFPPIEAVAVFAPLFTIYAALRGARFLRFKEASVTIVGWIVGTLSVFFPYAVYKLFQLLIPSAVTN